jgi:hypothetical protein
VHECQSKPKLPSLYEDVGRQFQPAFFNSFFSSTLKEDNKVNNRSHATHTATASGDTVLFLADWLCPAGREERCHAQAELLNPLCAWKG